MTKYASLSYNRQQQKIELSMRIKTESTCDREKISPGKRPSPLLSAASPSSLGASSLCERACIRSPTWLDPSLILRLGIRGLHNQHEDWEEGSEDFKRGLTWGKLEMCDEVERASMLIDSTERRE